MKRFLKNQFYFTRRERNGIIVLVGILLLVNLVMGYRKYAQSNSEFEHSTFLSEVAAIEDSLNKIVLEEKSGHLPALFDFNPNEVSQRQLESLGASSKLAGTIINYRNKGGKFYKTEDLARIYGMPAELLDMWSAFLIFPKKEKSFKRREVKVDKPVVALHSIDINRADTNKLMQVPGIGSYFARKIIDYRSQLLGFRDLEQLKEIYLVDTVKYQNWIPYLQLPQDSWSYININVSTMEQLSNHPYIPYRIASSIVKYRKQHGPFAAIEELKKLHLIDDAIFRKIAPYLSLND